MVLYKYLHPDRLDVLRKRRIRFTQPGDLNDPFEFRPHLQSIATASEMQDAWDVNFDQILEGEIGKLKALPKDISRAALKEFIHQQKSAWAPVILEMEPAAIQHIAPMFIEMFDRSTGILCLSELRDAQLMWSHYAASHKGYVVGFDTEHPFFHKRRGPNDEFGFLRKVDYSAKRPQVTLTNTFAQEWVQTKPQEWSYENEWRMMRVLSASDQNIPAEKYPICLFEFAPDAIVEIVVGMRCPATIRAEIEALAKNFPKAETFIVRESQGYDLAIDLLAP